MKKRVLSLFLALTLCLTLLPTAAFAEGETGGEDGTSGSSEPQYVAQVGETKYETMQDALDEMREDEITLLDDINEAELSTSVPTTINMNGYSITGDIEANDSLMLENGTVKGKVTVDAADGAFIMTAPAGAEAAIDGGLEVNDGSCSVSGAKIGVKDTLFFGGDKLTISGTEKAVELNAAAGPQNIELYGSATADGDTFTEAVFDEEQGTYTVSGETAKKLSTTQVGGEPEPEKPTLTINPTEVNADAGETATFTAAYTGTGELNAYIQKNGIDDNFTVDCVKDSENENTYTISVETKAETFTGTYTLYVHEVGDSFVKATAKIHIEGLTPAAEVKDVKYALLTEAIAAAQDGDTVKLLADHTTDWNDIEAGEYDTLAVVKKTLTLDLNGKTVDYLVVGEVVSDEEGGILDSTDGNLTIKDSGLGSVGAVSSLQLEKGKLTIEAGEIGTAADTSSFVCSDENGEVNIKGGLVWFFGCEGGGTANITGGKVYQLSVNPTGDDETVVNISGGTSHGGRNDGTNYDSSTWSVNGGTLNITGGTFGKVLFNYTGGNVDISGGTFQSISNSGASASAPVASLLADECAFYGKDTDGQYTVLKDGTETSLTDVTVKEHTHNVVNGACGCGLQFEAMITDAENNSKLYAKLADAAKAMQDDETLTLLADVDVSGISGGLVFGHDNTTFDLGGHRLYSSTTLNEFEITAILKIDAAWASVTLKNGKIEVNQDIYALAVWMTEGHLTLDDITVTAAGIRTNGAVYLSGTTNATIVSGDYQGLYLDPNATAVLEGGTFRPYKTQSGTGYSIFHQLSSSGESSRDCMDLLAEGYVYVNEAGEQVRTYGGFDYTVTVKKATAQPADAVARIDDTRYPSLREAIQKVQNGETIELLQSLDLGSGVVQLEENNKNFTIDLGGNQLQTSVQYLVYMMRGNGHVTIQNGTLDGSRAYYTIFVSSGYTGDLPRLTLKNVNAIGNSGYPVVQVGYNGTVEFDGGTYTGGVMIEATGNAVLKSGTFAKGGNSYSIQTKSSNKKLSNYLDGESLFWKEDGTLLNLSGETTTGDTVTVGPCEHNWVNGTCTICTKVCKHDAAEDGSMAAATCPTCGMKAAAEVEIGEVEKYFLTFSEALDCAAENEGCTLKLLADVVDVTVDTGKPFIFDLNGCTIHSLTANSRITLKDSSGGKGKIAENLIVNAAGLTVGDLLEEGYAFRSCLDDSWPLATVRTVGNVRVLPAPITSVTLEALNADGTEASTTMPYGTTGGVKLSASCTVLGTTADCKWYEIGGTVLPIDNAMGMNYFLPDDLAAGTHTYRVTFTSDGYSKSADITVTVTKANLSEAEIEFPYGNEAVFNYLSATGVPTFVVKYNGKEMERDALIITGDTFDGVGPCMLTVKAAENSNYTGSKSADWTVRPLKITASGANVVKTYDGTADLPANASITFKSVDSMYTGVAFGLSKGTDYQLLDARYDSPNAGEEKTVSFTVKLLEEGYVFEDGTRETSLALKGSTVKINKADAPNTSSLWLEQHVFNELAKTYEIDLKTLLPGLSVFCEYGEITYGTPRVTFTDTAYQGGDATLTNGVLRLPIASANTSKSEIGTLTVEVSSTNYQTFTLTLHIIADDKIVLNQEDVTVSATDITYGQTLNDSTLTTTGSMICPRTKAKIPGTFAWTDGTIKPDANNSYEAEWTFTPAAGYEEYAVATGTVTVKVEPAKLTVSVNASRAYYTGEAQIASIIASGQSVDSTPVTFTYSDKVDGNYTSGVPTFTDAGTYTAYYKAEAVNHEPATGTFTVTIDPLPISLLSVSSISKTYDGSADVTLTADKLTFFSKTAKATNIKLPDTALTFSDAQFTSKQEDGSYLSSPEVGNGKALSFTMTLTSNNYVFEGKSEGTTEVSDVFATDDVNRFTITKAAAPTATAGTLNVINGTTLDYTFDFNGLLPTLSDPKTYGAVSYTLLPFTFSKGYYFDSTTTGLKDGELLLASLDATGATSTGEIGTITVKVSTGNYEDFTLTLNLYAVDKIAPVVDGGITASDITYGQTLSESSITGKMKNPDTGVEVEGTFEWTAPSTKPNKAGDYEAEWVFTPEAPEYATVTGKVTVKVSTAPIIEASVSEPSYTYDGNSHMPSNITVKLTDGTTLVENTDYTVSAEAKTDAGTYEMKIIGIGNYHGGDSKTYHWRITPRTVNVPTVTVEDGVYNGGEAVTPTVTVKDGETVIPASEYEVTYSNNTNAGTATVTVKDVEGGNYVLSETSKTFEITKAAGVSLGTVELTQKYTDTSEYTYTPDWSELPTGQKWSYNSEYSVSTGSTATPTKQDFAADGSLLTYAISGGKAGDKITITLKASCDNYEDFTITLNVTLTEKDDQKPLTIIGDISVIYGEKLTLTTTGGSGTGAVTYRVDTDHSTGEATIDPNTGVLTPVKVGSVCVIATKEGDKDYNDVTSAPFVLMIKPATPTGEPKYTKITTSGKTLADAQLTVGTITPAGTISWDAGDTQSVAANTAYNWTFKPTDTVNYNNLTGSITPYTVSHSGGGGGSYNPTYAVVVDKTKNGTITVSPKSASKGDTVTITVKPDSGYVLDDLTVTDSKGNDLKLAGKGGGKYTFTMPSGKAMVEASFTPAKSENPFTDVPSGAYYEDAVAWAVNNGITGGTSATTFAPDGFCTRAQAVTFLWRAAGSPAPKSTAMAFTDVPAGSYYYDAVLWAIESGITKGTSDTTFSPNANCSRGQIVTFLWRSQKSPDAAAANPFTDVAADAYYISAVLWAVERNITGGTSATTFSPSANCTRAQIVTFIYRYMK